MFRTQMLKNLAWGELERLLTDRVRIHDHTGESEYASGLGKIYRNTQR